MAYNGSIELISGIRQANNGTFPLVDASAVLVDGNDKRLNAALQELNTAINSINDLISGLSIPSIDATLSIEGAAADAKVTGIEISKLKSKIFVGTYAEYQTANANNEIPINALVIITDDNESGNGSGGSGDSGDGSGENTSTSTSSKLCEGALGYMILG